MRIKLLALLGGLLILASGLGLVAQTADLPEGTYLNPVHKLLMYSLRDSSDEGARYDAVSSGHAFDLLAELHTDGKIVTAWNKVYPSSSPSRFVAVTSPSYPSLEVYMEADWIIPNAQTAVVLTESPIFPIPLAQSPSNTLISRGSVVIVDPSFQNSEFVKVYGWDYEHGTAIRGAIVLSSTLSDKAMDVAAATRLIVIQFMTSQTQEQKLLVLETPLEGAGSSFEQSAFYQDYLALNQELGGNVGLAEDHEPSRAEDGQGSLIGSTGSIPYRLYPDGRVDIEVVNTATLNVRSIPSTSGSVAGQLHLGDQVEIVGATLLQYMVNDSGPEYWYNISGPVSGWVFGTLLGEQ